MSSHVNGNYGTNSRSQSQQPYTSQPGSAGQLLQQLFESVRQLHAKLDQLESRLGVTTSHERTQADYGSNARDAHSQEDQEADPSRQPWLWVGGTTLPHKQRLKDAGGRWSPRKQAWYFVNCSELPASLRGLNGITWEVTH